MAILDRATDEGGYPVMDFELFYQQGISCFVWALPRHLVRQAFRRVCADRQAQGHVVMMWQVRAFVYGLSGRHEGGIRERLVSNTFRWPTPPDASWELVACAYPDGEVDLDWLHPVSCRFWSEDNGFLDLPSENRLLINRKWFEAMGFDVIVMQPMMRAKVAENTSIHLKQV